MRVAIQGFQASFHEIAAAKHFGREFAPVYCATFRELFQIMKQNEAEYAIVAIENTVAGTILPNLAQLRDSSFLRIIGEIYLRIEMNLMALPGQALAEIKEVHSHPMAMLQCEEFFENQPHITLVESHDTAESARMIHERQLMGVGAVASEAAARQFELEIVARGIETNKRNFTRFLVLQKEYYTKSGELPVPNKASISFHVSHRIGSLAKVLNVLAQDGINLTKIQSLPLIGREWEYLFLIDFVFEDINRYYRAIADIDPLTYGLKVLGIYREGDKDAL